MAALDKLNNRSAHFSKLREQFERKLDIITEPAPTDRPAQSSRWHPTAHQGYNAALLRQRLGEAVPAMLLPAPLPPAQLALGLDAAAPHTPAQMVQAPGVLTASPEPMPQAEGESELFACDGDAASYASDAASEADSDDSAEWAHDLALAPPAAIDALVLAPPADPVLEGPPAQEACVPGAAPVIGFGVTTAAAAAAGALTLFAGRRSLHALVAAAAGGCARA